MGCCGEREKFGDLRVEQKWEYINLDDFKARSCWTGFAYSYLWFMLFVSVSVYAVDTFTAINLLAFDRWAGRIEPAIPLRISRWIFAGCIILSFVLLIYRWIRALKVIKQGGVAKSYLDPLAVRLQSIRMGERGRGWKRFLVFAELTKSKKGADYVALFSYFSFEAWLRIVFAEGPRQVINAITLYSVTKTDLLPEGKHSATDGNSKFGQFWVNVGLLADQDRLQAVVLFGMLWTLVIWIFAAICLALSVVLYLLFLWHHIPSGDGGLASYCRIKINRRMERIVKVKVDKALKQENEIRARQEAKAARDGFELKKQPTLPSLDVAIDSLPPLSRQTTSTTLPEYSSRPGSAGNDLDSPPPMPSLPQTAPAESYYHSKTRGSDTSWSSYASNAPLMHQAADMASSPPGSAANPYTAPGAWNARPPPPSRSMTAMSAMSGPSPMRPPTAQSGRNTPRAYPHEPLARPGTTINNGPSRAASNGSDNSTYHAGAALPRGMPPRTGSWDQQADNQARRTPVQTGNPYFPPILETDSGRSSPMPNSAAPPRNHTPFSGPPRAHPPRSYTPAGPPPRSSSAAGPLPDPSFTPRGPPPRSYTAGALPDRSFTPAAPLLRSLTAAPPPSNRSMTPVGPPPRSFSAGVAPPNRSLTPSASRPDQATLPQLDTYDTYDTYDTLLDSYRTTTPEPLSTTATHSGRQATQDSNSQGLSSSRRPAAQRQGTDGSSEVDDILRHY
ncbi:hypothetical protein DV736_g2050, partial [Chaetothyriales sp. CBS 134916]